MHEKGVDPFNTSIRFDVIEITMKSGCSIRWIRNAFSYIPYSRTKPHWRVW
jgi:hypothetical protein